MTRPFVVLILSSLLLSATASASTMLALNLAELTGRSDVVIVGQVLGLQAEPAPNAIVTRALVRVETQVIGAVSESDELELIIPGGELNGVGMLVHGAPRLAPGGRYLLFLARRAPEYRVVGLSQGALPVTTDPAGAQVVEPPPNLPGLVRPRDGRLEAAPAAIVRATPLNQVILRVREARHGR